MFRIKKSSAINWGKRVKEVFNTAFLQKNGSIIITSKIRDCSYNISFSMLFVCLRC